MLSDLTPEQIIKDNNWRGRTSIPKIKKMLCKYGWEAGSYTRLSSKDYWKIALPDSAILKVCYKNKDGKLARTWHASLWFEKQVFDPAYGMNPTMYEDIDIVKIAGYIPIEEN